MRYAPKLLFVAILFVALLGCGPKVVYEKAEKIDPAGWTYADTIKFEFPVTDTLQVYDQVLELEHSPNYGYQNLYVKIHTLFPSGKRQSQVVSLELGNKIGLWFGDCHRDACTLNIPIQTSIFFPEVGTYGFYLEQFMRVDSLTGLSSLRLKILEEGAKKG